MKFSREEVIKTAATARLGVTEAEAIRLSAEIGRILSNAEKLNELDTSDVEPLVHIAAHCNVFRDDAVFESLDREKLMECAPSRKGGYYKVPIVVE